MARGKIVQSAGWIAILFECALGAWLALRIGIAWWTGVVLALLLGVILHGALTFLFRRSGQPRETYATLKKWLLWPAFILTLVSILAVLAVRVLTGWLLLALLPFLGLSLWSATIGLLLLGAALLVASDVYEWSRRDAREYAAIDYEQHKSENVRREFEEDLRELEKIETQQAQLPVSHANASSSPNGNNAVALARTLPLLLLAACLTWTTACTTGKGDVQSPPSQPGDPTANSNAPQSNGGTYFDIYVDASQSPSTTALRDVIRRLIDSLPRIVERWNVRRLTGFLFAQDGWNVEEKVHVDLPELRLPKVTNYDAGEFKGFRNVEEAQEQQTASDANVADTQARTTYRGEIHRLLATITEDALMPPPKSELEKGPPCTDVNGVLGRVGNSKSLPRIVLVISDGHETCQPTLNQIPDATENILVFALLPEGNKPGQRDFDLRKAQIAKAAPWIQVVPYFNDLDTAISEAKAKRASTQTPTNR